MRSWGGSFDFALTLMTDDVLRNMRERASDCRRLAARSRMLAKGVSNEHAEKTLLAIATDFEAEAARLEAQFGGPGAQ